MNNNIAVLRHRLVIAVILLIIAALAITTATFAWYIYNTNAHTTKVHMAAGSSVSLQISNEYNGTYSSSAILKSFSGMLNPVSTDKILEGSSTPTFQKVLGFTNGTATTSRLVANVFGHAENSDYYMTSLFIKTNGGKMDLYISNIGYEDSSAQYPISSAMRVGFVVHKAGINQPVENEFIFDIAPNKHNPAAEYNTQKGQDGHVLDHTKSDGETIAFTPYNTDNYAEYDQSTGVVTLKSNSKKLCELAGDDKAVQVDVYLWLEGCDSDCTNTLLGTTLKNLALSFAGYEK